MHQRALGRGGGPERRVKRLKRMISTMHTRDVPSEPNWKHASFAWDKESVEETVTAAQQP